MNFNISKSSQSGNVMVYILIALALIGALTMTLGRQNERASNQGTSEELLNFQATRIKSYAASAQDSINKMLITGANVTDLLFYLPNVASFDSGTNIYKVYHPEGGGLNPGVIDPVMFTGTDTDPPKGWYMGAFNNVGWTRTGANDVVLVAHLISQPLCAKLNKDITGSATIPAIAGTGNLRDYFVDTSLHGGGANSAFTSAVCASCDQKISMCVSNSGGDMWSFYTIIESQ